MFRPQIQKTRVLVLLAIISYLCFRTSSESTSQHYAKGYNEKLEAAEIMEDALKILKKKIKKKGYTVFKDIAPNLTGLIFLDNVSEKKNYTLVNYKLDVIKNFKL